MATPSKTPPGADPKQLERTGTVREIGSQAVWSLSSCKPGFGVDQLRDDNLETYWQSDGSQPHLVNIQFRRRTTVKMLCIYADYKSDESYTPSKISVRVGNNFHNLQEIRVTTVYNQSLHAGGGELHRKVPTMHHGRLHDVPHHQVIWTDHGGGDPTRPDPARRSWSVLGLVLTEYLELLTDEADLLIPELIGFVLLIIKVLLNVFSF
uniref:Anaphase-promoting complex subunit 10 n=1 Tax=Dicentrarchus labrax TaxID=13489 RepID=A0A8P4GCX6_DICLA